MFDLNKKSVLVTGGTGSFGRRFIEMTLKKFPQISRLVIYSRDELKQFEMAQTLDPKKYPSLRYFIGDVRDKDRLVRAFEGIDYVIHAAALKQVPAAEYNPMECIKTNVLGAENVINAAIDRGVKKVVALSTDKAAAPTNLYGATKLCADKLFVAANNMVGTHDIKFSVVRYGNVMGSRGSVVPFFLKERLKGEIPITHPDMTRFNITLEQGVQLVFHALENAWGGEIFVPKIPSFKVVDLAKAIAPDCKMNIVGLRPGEKIHEEMITQTDSYNCMEFRTFYVITPATPQWEPEEYMRAFQGQPCKQGFSYNSGTNDQWLSVNDLKQEVERLTEEEVAALN